jgi:hypothetical protein
MQPRHTHLNLHHPAILILLRTLAKWFNFLPLLALIYLNFPQFTGLFT